MSAGLRGWSHKHTALVSNSPEGQRVDSKDEEVDKANAEASRHALLCPYPVGSHEMAAIAV